MYIISSNTMARIMENKTGFLFLMLLLLTSSGLAQENNQRKMAPPMETTSYVLPQIQVVQIQDAKTERTYELYIELPEKYSEQIDKTYPVLYYTDAKWHLEVLSACQEFMLEEVILVGISWQKDIDYDLKEEVGEHVSRFRDYSISEHSDPEVQKKYQLGQAQTHLNFIRNEVIHYVDQTYRTDPNSRTYFGYSLGGEFGAYILLTKPDTFNNYILGSPSIKTELPLLTELNTAFGSYESSNRNSSLNANVFISYGSLEDDMEEPIEAFVDLLKSRRDLGLSVQREVVEGSHQTAFPMTAVRSAAWLSSLLDHGPGTDQEITFLQVPQMNTAFVSTAPEAKDDGIAVGELGVDGGDKAMLLEMVAEIAADNPERYDSFLVAHRGKLLFESYYARGRMDLPHFQASATKAYTSLALGRAIQMGYLSMEDLDKPIIAFLNELDPTQFVEGVEKITLAKALTMRSGIRISEEQQKELDKNREQLKGQGQVQAYLAHTAPITEGSQTFKYQDDPTLVMQVLEAVVPGSAQNFIKTELLNKLGIDNYSWATAASGLPEAGWGTKMNSRDMVKWGLLTANEGQWNGEQLVSKEFIDQATSRMLLTGDEDVYGGGKDVSNQGYGYYWWSADLNFGDKTYFASSAQGGGGQYIILIEELDLIMVVTAHENENSTLQRIAEKVIPAFVR